MFTQRCKCLCRRPKCLRSDVNIYVADLNVYAADKMYNERFTGIFVAPFSKNSENNKNLLEYFADLNRFFS